MKRKGSAAERELVTLFNGAGWSAIRAAGSGVQRFYSPDVLTGNGSKILAIECKSTKYSQQYFSPKQIFELKEFARIFGAKPLIAVKFQNKWSFFNVEDLKETRKNLVIKQDSHKTQEFFDVVN